MATFQTFQSASSLSYPIGQQTVTATASSAACPAATAGALMQLFGDTSTTQATRQQTVALIANPQFGTWISTVQSAMGTQLSPFNRRL